MLIIVKFIWLYYDYLGVKLNFWVGILNFVFDAGFRDGKIASWFYDGFSGHNFEYWIIVVRDVIDWNGIMTFDRFESNKLMSWVAVEW